MPLVRNGWTCMTFLFKLQSIKCHKFRYQPQRVHVLIKIASIVSLPALWNWMKKFLSKRASFSASKNISNINESIVTQSPVERQFIIFWLWPFWSKPRSNCFQKAAFKCSTCSVLDFSRTYACGHGQTAQQPFMKTSHETYSTSVCICTESEQLSHTFILKRQQLAAQNPVVFNIKFAVYPTASSLSSNHSPYQQKTR